jgi:hypothetical protein
MTYAPPLQVRILSEWSLGTCGVACCDSFDRLHGLICVMFKRRHVTMTSVHVQAGRMYAGSLPATRTCCCRPSVCCTALSC